MCLDAERLLRKGPATENQMCGRVTVKLTRARAGSKSSHCRLPSTDRLPQPLNPAVFDVIVRLCYTSMASGPRQRAGAKDGHQGRALPRKQH